MSSCLGRNPLSRLSREKASLLEERQDSCDTPKKSFLISAYSIGVSKFRLLF